MAVKFSHVQEHLGGFREHAGMRRREHFRHSCGAISEILRYGRSPFSQRGAPPFPLNKQGMGTRSLGTILTFWACMTWRQKRASSGAVHPMIAMEEPEAHLHPQAQRALFGHIGSMPGQPASSVRIRLTYAGRLIADIRHFTKDKDETRISLSRGNGKNELSDEDLRKIVSKSCTWRHAFRSYFGLF